MEAKKRLVSDLKRAAHQKAALAPSQPYFGDKRTHAAWLEKLCIAALMKNDAEMAFRYIDRRCRITPPPSAYHHVLRAEALAQRSEIKEALKSIETALEAAPEDLEANRRMLAWGKGEQRIRAARVLCRHDKHVPVLIEAAKVLKHAGRPAVGSIQVFDTSIKGWAAWKTARAPLLTVYGEGFEEHLELKADSDPLLKPSGFKNYAQFEWVRESSQNLQSVRLTCGDDIILSERIAKPRSVLVKATEAPPQKVRTTRGKRKVLTIVVPIYRDFPATRACLESLRPEIAEMPSCRLILVNDASPEPKMAPYLARFAKSAGAELLTNAQNLGFVGSVNRALDLIQNGDVILLNADTVLPGTALRRLQENAYHHPQVGTITPLSNNGEFTSFPIALRANPLPSDEEIAVLDRIAARVNKNVLVDIPSGIGFCLFISEACFKAVGALTDSFHGGYLEDVDLCLRAREKGFRNVCDCSVFVGHAGTRSFLADKRNLVVRNLPIIDERFPNDREETKAFLRLDPLRPARAAIELAITAKSALDVLIVTGGTTAKMIAQRRAVHLQRNGFQVWLAEVERDAVSFTNVAEAMPQSLNFRFDTKEEPEALTAYVRGLRSARIELAGLGHMPPSLLELFSTGKRSPDIFMSDGAWMLNLQTRQAAQGRSLQQVSAKDKDANAKSMKTTGTIIVPSEMASCFVQHHFPRQKDAILIEPLEPDVSTVPVHRKKTAAAGSACGMIVCSRAGEDFLLIKDIVLEMRRLTMESSFVVLGETLDDLALLPLDNVFVTAAIGTGELSTLCGLYNIGRLFVATRRPLFGHPLIDEAQATELPFSYFDWSYGMCQPERRDLALSPDLDAKNIAKWLATWMMWQP